MNVKKNFYPISIIISNTSSFFPIIDIALCNIIVYYIFLLKKKITFIEEKLNENEDFDNSSPFFLTE